MKRLCGVVGVLLCIASPAAAQSLATGLKGPQAVTVAGDGRAFVSVDGDGAVIAIANGKAMPFAEGLNAPRGLAAWQGFLFVADKGGIWRFDAKGKGQVFAAAAAFPAPLQSLTGLAVDIETGTLYASDTGAGVIYRIDPKGKVSLVTDAKRAPALKAPTALQLDGKSFLLVLDSGSGELFRVKVADGSATKVADGFGTGAGLVWDKFGQLFIADGKGRLFGMPRPDEKPVAMPAELQSAGGIAVDATGKRVLVVDPKAGSVVAVSATIPGFEVDDTPLPVETAVAFPDLQWAGWKGVTEKGTLNPLRPIVLTHAGDGSNRVFVATQHGVIHVFPNDQKAKETKVFLDIQDRCIYDDKQNEEGFLGLAFHPQYKKNGEFFVFYTLRKAKLINVVSRFRVSKDDPDRADPSSEEELLRFEKPFWNHDGGTIAFGPDGYLYITHGDGGAADDPHENGQNLKTLLGKVLRIDVDRKDDGKKYAIPKDNPFVGKADARPEIYAYGLRNIWRMAFDRKTGQLYAGEVGQNLFEEINLIVKGGNYGWNIRESFHPFGAKGVGARPDLVDPIWEYHHDIGKSITGGTVYRGERLPELDGFYLYADYVTGRIWGLKYDPAKKRAVANRPIKDRGLPILSFGEDEKGEVYLMTFTPSGKGIYWFVKPEKGKP